MAENKEVLAGCEVEFAGPAPGPRIDWHFGNATQIGPKGTPKTRLLLKETEAIARSQ